MHLVVVVISKLGLCSNAIDLQIALSPAPSLVTLVLMMNDGGRLASPAGRIRLGGSTFSIHVCIAVDANS